MRAAADILGITAVEDLGWQTDVLGDASRVGLRERIIHAIRRLKPYALMSFDPNALSNNHLLASDPRLVRLLRSVRPGDQVRVEGYLAEYSHQHGRSFRRGTSTVRTDRGDGACETIWVTEAQVLRTANRGWRLLMPIGLGAIALSVLLWWFVPLPRLSD